MAHSIGRRKFLADSALTAAGMVLGNAVTGCASNNETVTSDYDVMKEVMKYRKIDAHAHIYSSADHTPEWHLDFADRLGIEKLQISRPSLPFQKGGLVLPETPEQVRECNDLVYTGLSDFLR